MNDNNTIIENMMTLPMLPLRGISVFPGMMLGFDVERPVSLAALNAALGADQRIFLAPQRDIRKETPAPADLYNIGTVCRIKQLLRIPGAAAVKVMVEGLNRARVHEITGTEPFFTAEVEVLSDENETRGGVRAEALVRQCCSLMDDYVNLTGSVTPDTLITILASEDPGYIADFVAQNIYLQHTKKQLILEELHPMKRLRLICNMLEREIRVLSAEQELREATEERVVRNQREYYLREQMKIIKAELGDEEEDDDDISSYRSRIAEAALPEQVEEKLRKELQRLSKQPFGSAEAAVIRTYLDTCLELPWNKRSKERADVARAAKILDEDHYGLDKVKERVLEFLSVKQLAPEVKGGVLCLVGPPGTGKTSIAMSIARATGRKLVRMSLGGVHDEAEIRGHRKTYVGAMPGRIISGVLQAGVSNPLMVLDEIDKLGSDYRGDPSAALLEALDAEQNGAFRDHFLEIPFDLSEVFFVTTANTTETIPRPLLDRMEVIELTSYTDEEKLEIAKRHLIPKQRKKHGLGARQLKLSDDAVREIIAMYTRESGVRVLEREIAAVCRKCAKGVAEESFKSLSVHAGELQPLLGVAKYRPEPDMTVDAVGLVRGLAWTSVGGEVLEVECAVVDGKGELLLTGNLGDVMKESARAAVTYIRSRAAILGIDPEFHSKKDVHLHFPEGAVPKDGPSAGITICVALISALTGIPARRDIAMTGEITLTGRVLPIGGLKEKTMAALRSGVHKVIIPAENERDLEEIDQNVRNALTFVTASHVDDILDVALAHMPLSGGKREDVAELSIPQPGKRDAGSIKIRQ